MLVNTCLYQYKLRKFICQERNEINSGYFTFLNTVSKSIKYFKHWLKNRINDSIFPVKSITPEKYHG